MHFRIFSMERVVRFNGVALWALFLVSYSATLSHGDVNKGLAILKKHMHAKDAIFETFEIDGEVIDCVDIYKQPAFGHPSLINHTIQMEPTHYPEKIIRTNEDDLIVGESQPWYLPKSCPKGSIPIRRTPQRSTGDHHRYGGRHRRHLLRQREIRNQKAFISQNFEAADAYFPRAKYNGGRATINVWNPKVAIREELSASLIGLTLKDSNIHLDAGWLVYPDMSHDNRTRFFVRWTTNSVEPICYNLKCRGFVQTNPHTILDTTLQPVSTYGGDQYGIDVAIAKDKDTGNWWVYMQGAAMGYWPKDLLPALENSAQIVKFSGEIYNTNPGGHHTSTEMGSGHFSSEGFRKASFFRNVQVYDHSFQYVTPGAGDVVVEAPHGDCYDAHAVEDLRKMGNWGYYFWYGGPGKSDKCF